MLSIAGTQVWAILASLDSFCVACRDRVLASGMEGLIADDEKTSLLTALVKVEETCNDLELKYSLNRIAKLRIALIGERHNAVVLEDIHGLRISIMEEAGDKLFIYIPSDNVVFFESDHLAGFEVNNSFPSAAAEIKDGGTCLALDLNTAAVFHLMRAAEHGLRGLARHLKVKVKGTIEYADWGNILAAIDKKLSASQSKPRGKKKSEELEFFRLIQSELNTLKDVWRNNVMHTRGRYTHSEAVGVLLRVQEFMRRLCQRVKEN